VPITDIHITIRSLIYPIKLQTNPLHAVKIQAPPTLTLTITRARAQEWQQRRARRLRIRRTPIRAIPLITSHIIHLPPRESPQSRSRFSLAREQHARLTLRVPGEGPAAILVQTVPAADLLAGAGAGTAGLVDHGAEVVVAGLAAGWAAVGLGAWSGGGGVGAAAYCAAGFCGCLGREGCVGGRGWLGGC
jgi:hypothetical protein